MTRQIRTAEETILKNSYKWLSWKFGRILSYKRVKEMQKRPKIAIKDNKVCLQEVVIFYVTFF